MDLVVHVVRRFGQYLSPINLWRDFKSNFRNLKTQATKLKDKSRRIRRQVDAAKRNGDGIEENVQMWLERADELEAAIQKWMERASNIIGDDQAVGKMTKDEETAAAEEIGEGEETAAKKRCFKGFCPDLKARYELSKEGETLQQAIVEHLEAGSFGKISYPVIPKDPSLFNRNYEAFESRTSTLNNVISSLIDPNVNVVGVYGMGGIGKTTLVKEVAMQIEANEVFDSVIFVEVTEKPEIINIQRQIAEKMGIALEGTESTRAVNLYGLLAKKKKILTVLDNIWSHFDLLAIGIPLGGGSKLLLTARSVEVLTKMNSQRNFRLQPLYDEEAWRLFKKMSRGDIDSSEFSSLAREVAKKCARLPIVIVTVARALRNKELFAWKDALQKLNIVDICASIELSFNYLATEDLKKTILLIRYANITSIDELLMYGMGLSLFVGINKMEERRARVLTLVQQLKDSCLLIDGNTIGEDFSMHDVVRDVIVSIASRDLHVFTKQQFGELVLPDENMLKVYPSIILEDVEPGYLPQVLECQKLKLLSISGTHLNSYSLQIYDDFFKRMAKLQVLVLVNMDLSSLPSSFCFLTNLRVLGLHNCKLGDIAIIKELKILEILSFKNSYIEQLPVEVGHLPLLKSLDLRVKYGLDIIPPNVISSFSHLEELYIDSFVGWEEEGLNKDRKKASLDELKKLSNLTCLEIKIQDAKTLPRDLFFEKLERYKIEIGSLSYEDWIWGFMSPKSTRKFILSLINTNICLKDGHIMQLRGIENLCLSGSQDMESVLYGLDRDGFPQLKYLQVRDNHNLLCIVDSIEDITPTVFPVLESLLIKNLICLEKICRQLTTESSFGQLSKIRVERCDKLENIFSFSIARRLQLLQSIDVICCTNIEEVFVIEKEDESVGNISEVIDYIKFSQLRSLTLIDLPQLKSFCSKLKTPSTSQQRQGEIILVDDINVSNSLLTEEVALPSLEVLELEEIKVERIWQNEVAAMSSGIQSLTRLFLCGCNNLRCLFSSSIASCFVQLQYLKISKCQALEEIVVIDKRSNVVFPQLQFLKMECLENLTKFCSGDYIEFPSLKELWISNCPKLKGFMVKNISSDLIKFPLPLFNEKVGLPKLEVLELHEINVKSIWHNQVATLSSGIQNLTRLILSSCNNLRYLSSSSMIRSFDRLQYLEIYACRALEEIMVIDDEDGLRAEERKNNVAFPISNIDLEMRVERCDKLKTIFSRNMYRKFLRLESLSIFNCDSLEVIFDLEGSDFEDKCSAIVCQLSKLDIVSLPKLKHVWNKYTPKFFSFQKLNSVRIVKCDKLENVFPTSVASSLSQLKRLDIRRCGVEEIVFVTKEGSETNLRFVFPALFSLTLKDLPNFTTFFPRRYTIEWPALKKLMVKNLSLQESNADGQLLFLLEKIFPNLEELIVNGKSVKAIWQFANEIPKDLICKLKHLGVKFDKSTAFSSLDFLQKFSSIKMLQILGGESTDDKYESTNDEFEAIDDEDEKGMSAMIINLNMCSDLKHILKEESNMDHLVHLEVANCYNLVNLVPSSTYFRNLITLEVYNCEGLTKIVTCSTARSLGQLKQMRIEECCMIKELVAADEGDEAKDYEIVFGKLEELNLIGLSSLVSFCSTNYTLKFPSLEELIVKECPEMKSFSGGNLSTPKLQNVKHWRNWQVKEYWKVDLNSTIQELHEAMQMVCSGDDETNKEDTDGKDVAGFDVVVR